MYHPTYHTTAIEHIRNPATRSGHVGGDGVEVNIECVLLDVAGLSGNLDSRQGLFRLSNVIVSDNGSARVVVAVRITPRVSKAEKREAKLKPTALTSSLSERLLRQLLTSPRQKRALSRWRKTLLLVVTSGRYRGPRAAPKVEMTLAEGKESQRARP